MYHPKYQSDDATCLEKALAFNRLYETSECLEDGVEVFSLMRRIHLVPADYLDRFHEPGNECIRNIDSATNINLVHLEWPEYTGESKIGRTRDFLT